MYLSLDNNSWDILCTATIPNADWDIMPEKKALQVYFRACDVRILVKLNVLEKLTLPMIAMSPTATKPISASASVTGTELVSLISTSQSICGVSTSLFGPVTMQVMVKLSPAMGIPGTDIAELNRLFLSTVNEVNSSQLTCIIVH